MPRLGKFPGSTLVSLTRRISLFDPPQMAMIHVNPVSASATGVNQASPQPQPDAIALDLLWEIPLAMLSWLFFKLNKLIIGGLYAIYLHRQSQRASTWRILSAETLRIPISLPVLMTKGPRWNTHAIIGTLGPFRVTQDCWVERSRVEASAQSWTIVVYDYPAYATVTQISSLDPAPAHSSEHPGWQVIALPPGMYSLGVRYYEVVGQPRMPAVKLSPDSEIPAAVAPSVPNQVYDTLAERGNFYYLALHAYIFTLLRLRPWLSDHWVRREYLPVGNPDTLFRYGYIRRGQLLTLEVEPNMLEDYWLYLTVYNRASLPIISTNLQNPSYCSEPLPSDGFYLLRIRPKTAEIASQGEPEIRIERWSKNNLSSTGSA